MSILLSIHLPFPARGKGSVRTGKGFSYTDQRTRAYMADVQSIARASMRGEPHDGPVKLTIHAHFAMAKSWTRAKREALDGRLHTQKPDTDNIQKAIADALNGIAYHDDSQIAISRVEKRWLDRPGVRVTVEAAA